MSNPDPMCPLSIPAAPAPAEDCDASDTSESEYPLDELELGEGLDALGDLGDEVGPPGDAASGSGDPGARGGH